MKRWVLSLSDQTKRRILHGWFLVDAILVLFPPLYWAAGSPSAARAAIPWSLLYFLATGACIVLSVLAAQYVENIRGELN